MPRTALVIGGTGPTGPCVIEGLLQRAGEIYAAETPPESTPGCGDCEAMERLLEDTASGG